MRRSVRWALVALATLATSVVPLTLSAAPASADAPNLQSGNGITVSGWRWISARTLEVDISTAKVAASAVNGPHRVRITLPNDYFQSGSTRYPVLYLEHGGAGGNSAQWTTGGGAVEPITDGQPLITVMPDGGKVGWFTNWVSQAQGAQAWEDFHINQLIPWVDANLRTIASKQGRAIAGLSMGGFGAVRYAQDRPDLFAFVGSFSGAVDLGDSGTRTVVTEQALQNGYSGTAIFGNPFWPFDGTWNAVNPLARAARLQGVSVALYAGGGSNDADVLEGTMRASADRFKAALDAAGVPASYWMYGRPGASLPWGCDGGHNFGCWNLALSDAVPRMMTVLQHPGSIPPPPPAGLADGGFEAAGLGPWACTANCGADHGTGLARTGTGNGWVRNNTGWNDVHQTIGVQANHTYTITAWVRTSANNADGYFGLRTLGGQVLGETHFGRLDGYTQLTVTVNTGANTSAVVYGGLWANGDTWLQIDDVSAVAQ
jgi:S-formylglutathione hydrolase FrmB